MTDTFGGVTFHTREIIREIIVGTYYYEVTVVCRTDSSSNYAALGALAGLCTVTLLLSGKTAVQTTGTKGSLVLAGTTHTNCAIKDISCAELPRSNNTAWEYQITFVKDTTS